ncbi:hypothetical protein [Aeromicrobium sp.]|uniref:hypothetical protein n=1 Tax=Aeromicrobium sp. TaxID=1871063 RepID=UPI0019A6AF45|nr:hypothetical protein [Aeromicrobium sp.]MBC7633334.1 hypothetical protein [Aeromicrobium sp.]
MPEAVYQEAVVLREGGDGVDLLLAKPQLMPVPVRDRGPYGCAYGSTNEPNPGSQQCGQ